MSATIGSAIIGIEVERGKNPRYGVSIAREFLIHESNLQIDGENSIRYKKSIHPFLAVSSKKYLTGDSFKEQLEKDVKEINQKLSTKRDRQYNGFSIKICEIYDKVSLAKDNLAKANILQGYIK